MKVNVYGKDVSVSAKTEERLSEKLSFLDKYLMIDEATNVQCIIKKHGANDVKLEITIPSKVGYLRSEVVNKDLDVAIDDSIEKLEKQISRQKNRLSRRHREKLAKAFASEIEAELPVVEQVKRIKRVVADELDSEEAILQMELTGHSFFVYKDIDTKMISVIYRREDGDYGILEVA